MGGMCADEAHAFLLHPLLNFIYQLIANFVMLFVAPPDQHIGALDQGVADALVWIIEAGFDDFPALGFEWLKAFSNRAVDIVGIDGFRIGINVGGALGPDDDFAFGWLGEHAQIEQQC